MNLELLVDGLDKGFSTRSKKYYDKVYDIAKIIVIKSIIKNEYSYITQTISQILNIRVTHNYITLRINIYLSTYFSIFFPEKTKKFSKALYLKLIEFKTEPKSIYFTQNLN